MNETIISIFLGIGLAASVGFRVFLPLLVLSLSSYFDMWHLNESWQWLGSLTAVIILSVATVIEILAYFVPIVDNLLDTIAVPLAALAGTAVMVSTIADLDPIITWSLAIIAGGGTAAAVAGTTGVTRLTSTATTAGLGNPFIAGLETLLALVGSLLSIMLPIIAVVFVIVVLLVIWKAGRKIKTAKK